MRVCTSLAVTAVALALSIGGALAQYYPPPPPPVYPGYAPPPSAYPPPYPSPGYSNAPLPPPGYYDDEPVPAGRPYDRGAVPGQQTEAYPPAPRPYFMPNDPYAPQPLPPQGPPGLRPPADVGGVPGPGYTTGAVPTAPGAAPAPPNPTVIAALPPDDQPEQGPVKELAPQFRRQLVNYVTTEPPGTIIIDTPNTFLYLVLGHAQAMRYGIGVGREGFTWAGTERISRMKEWPDWFPPKEMIDRQPYLPRFMAGGESNPLGARALYLGNTLYRIHGTNQPSTIGSFVSSGCIRLTNEDIADLFGRVQVGTRVVVLPGSMPATAASQGPIGH